MLGMALQDECPESNSFDHAISLVRRSFLPCTAETLFVDNLVRKPKFVGKNEILMLLQQPQFRIKSSGHISEGDITRSSQGKLYATFELHIGQTWIIQVLWIDRLYKNSKVDTEVDCPQPVKMPLPGL